VFVFKTARHWTLLQKQILFYKYFTQSGP